MKKYAFVIDVCRLEALYNEGGIYFDTDIEVIRDFTSALNNTSFIGYEVNNLIGTGVIGSVRRQQWIKMILDSYNNEHFISNDGSLNLYANTQRITAIFENMSPEIKPKIYPIDVFCAKDWMTGVLCISPNTMSIHNYKSSWISDNRVPCDIVEERICRKLKMRNHHIFVRILKKTI